MWGDLQTVAWKELTEWFSPANRRASAGFLLLNIVFVGIVFPVMYAEEWLVTAWPVFMAALYSLLATVSVTADAFVGERERHTLETLLASRLPDRAILFGKAASSMTYAWGQTLVSLMVGLFTANILAWDGHVVLYRPVVALAAVGISGLLVALGTSGVILISLHASSVQQVQQTFSIVVAVILAVPMLMTVLLSPEQIATALDKLGSRDPVSLVLVVMAVLLVAAAALLALAMARFQRAHLILD